MDYRAQTTQTIDQLLQQLAKGMSKSPTSEQEEQMTHFDE
jgi:hypothetical protein